MAEKKKIGDLLKEAGLIDDFQLESALAHQRNWGGKLGSILIEKEFVREDKLASVIAEKLGLEYINLFEPELSAESLRLIKPEIARKYSVIPIRKVGNSITLAMADPLDIDAIDDLKFSTGCNIKPALSLESEIKDAIRKYYDGETVVRKPIQVNIDKPGKMEVIFGSDLMMGREGAKANAVSAQEAVATKERRESEFRLEALITLLIEQNIIKREDLVKMIYQKKIGL